jgi:hypothetical protein
MLQFVKQNRAVLTEIYVFRILHFDKTQNAEDI